MSFFSNPDGSQQRQLGDVMIELEMITPEQLDVALEMQRRSGDALGQILVELGFASGAAVAHALAIQAGRSLRTEYGFALGVPASSAGRPAPGDPRGHDASTAEDAMTLPKLRLVNSAFSSEGRREEKAEARPDRVETPAETAPLASAGWDDALLAENEQLRTALHEVQAAKDSELLAISEERDRLEASVLATQEALSDAREQLALVTETAAEVGRLQDLLEEARTASANELTRVSEERNRLASGLAELEAALGSALSRLTTADAAAARAGELEAALEDARAQLARQAEQELRELGEVEEQRSSAVAEAERLSAALGAIEAEAAAIAEAYGNSAAELAEAQQARAELEERLAVGAARAEESARDLDRLTVEHERLAASLGQTQDELRAKDELLGAAREAAAGRDALAAEVDRLEARLAELAGEHAAARSAAEAEHARLASELAAIGLAEQGARERLAAAELEAAARAEAATELEAERDTLARKLDDAELALAVASLHIEARNRAEAEVGRLRRAVESWQAWAQAAPAGGSEPIGEQAKPQDSGEVDHPSLAPEAREHMLLVPTGNGYELVRRDGPSPDAGETVEVPTSDDGETRRFVVARVGRSALPDRGVCVYLIPE